jgi:hypothetical protein
LFWASTSHRNAIAEGYGAFRVQIEEISEHREISVKQADEFLWLRGQKEWAAVEGADYLSGEVQWVMEQYPALWNRL